jgi:D-3-phosphoglycerate dehydrogenase
MTKPRVLISDSMSSQAVGVFEDRGVDVVASSKLSETELLDTIGDFDGLAIRSSTNVTNELLERATRLKVVGRAGIGVDNVDVPACTRRGVVVMNTPLGNAITTAEHIGAGNIGSIVASKAIGYGLHVQAYDPFLTEERAAKLGVRKVELDELLQTSDIISLHVPKTPETSNIISASAINQMKQGSMLINCARGGLVDELALKAALESGHLKGAALDVYEVEPARENPLFELDNVICTPHLGASTIEAQEKVAIQIAEQISDFLLTGAVNNAINAPSISAEEAQLLRPYLQLAQCLGSFVGQLTHDPIKSLTVTYGGEANDLNVSPLTVQVVQSILEHHSSYVNSVNAREVARDRNIDVIEAHNEGRDEYPCRITVGVETESKSRSICGTLIQNRPRVIDVKGIPLESKLGEHMLYITNNDKPGVIGDIGTTTAERGINIANMHLGRDIETGNAIALLEVDETPKDIDLDHMRSLPNINDVQYLHFPALQ